MAHGDQLRSTLHTHDTCHTGHTKYITLFHISTFYRSHDLRAYLNGTGSCRCTVSDRFIVHIHHNSIAIFIKMIQFHI